MTPSSCPLVVVAGPTASGKTALAVELCHRFNGEVVSADSMQVYEELRVGTARPDEQEQRGIPHHLMGVLPLGSSYSVAKYAEEAHRVIGDIHRRGKLAVLCGGTGLYIQAVTDNLTYEDQVGDRQVRERLRQRAEQEGTAAMLAELALVDPETAARLHPNDIGRIVRALEIYQVTGRTITQQNEASRKTPSPYRVCGLLLEYKDRATLYNRIDKRVSLMLEAGLVEEARRLLACPEADTVRQAIGYKEWIPYFSGECTLEQAADDIRRATRRYAKRQLSWFRHREEFVPLYMDETTIDPVERAAALVEGFLASQ